MKPGPPFLVPAVLDDAGLSPNEFRVLAHLYRRVNGKGFSAVSAAGIAEVCRLCRRTVISVLSRLEKRGAIMRSRTRSQILRQDLRPFSAWVAPSANTAPLQTLHQCKESHGGGANDAPQRVQHLHPKGNNGRKSFEGDPGAPPEVELPKGFLEFWSLYPKKVAKRAAIKAWSKIESGDEAAVIAALAWQAGQESWTKEGGRFIPHPATWLNGRRWEDEQPSAATAIPTKDYSSWEVGLS